MGVRGSEPTQGVAMRLSRSIVGQAEAEAVANVIIEDGYLGMGAATGKFEESIAQYLGVDRWQVVSVNSGTAALHLAVEALKNRLFPDGAPGSAPEILIPTLTFVASFQAVSAAGLKPVACDVLVNTGTLDLDDAEKRITSRTIGVMHVDYASNPWHLDNVYAFAKKHSLAVIDDAAHAFGCRHHGRKIGSFGDLVCFSFDGIKNITCGEGGCLVAFDRESADFAADARLLGVRGDTGRRLSGGRSWDPDVTRQGWRYHLSNIMAAIGLAQLKRLETEFVPARRKLWSAYRELLADAPNIALLETDPRDYIVPHIMPVRILNGLREKAVKALADAGIPTGTHYKPNHLLTLFGGGQPRLPVAEKLYQELATLPLHPGLSMEDVEKVCSCLVKAVR